MEFPSVDRLLYFTVLRTAPRWHGVHFEPPTSQVTLALSVVLSSLTNGRNKGVA